MAEGPEPAHDMLTSKAHIPNLPMKTHRQIVFLPEPRSEMCKHPGIFVKRLSCSRNGQSTYQGGLSPFLEASLNLCNSVYLHNYDVCPLD